MRKQPLEKRNGFYLFLFFTKALFSNFVAIGYKIELNYLRLFTQFTTIMRKELANLVPTYKMAIITLKSALGF